MNLSASNNDRLVSPCPNCGAVSTKNLYGYKIVKRKSDLSESPEQIAMNYAFEIFGNDVNQIDAHSVICKYCGLITLVPRPTNEQLGEKYNRIEPLLKGRYSNHLTFAERSRSKVIFDIIQKRKNLSLIKSIVDVGGANGRNMVEFVNKGHRCIVVDMGVKQPIDGVTWGGATLDNLATNEKFDLAISSHTLEHVTNPIAELIRIRETLTDSGVVYVEVPHGCYREVRKQRLIDLVGHINYFSKASLTEAIARAGFVNIKATVRVMRYSETYMPCIVATALNKSHEDIERLSSRLLLRFNSYTSTLLEMHNPWYYSVHVAAKCKVLLARWRNK